MQVLVELFLKAKLKLKEMQVQELGLTLIAEQKLELKVDRELKDRRKMNISNYEGKVLAFQEAAKQLLAFNLPPRNVVFLLNSQVAILANSDWFLQLQ
ncbi:hypothetical protein NPIL_439351 [Nephila pilipes]|uniref:Uncharacterized protein n=1 Tax=Nephila pilipes TaxID=299642 RepID=A0A8X6MAQ0_NEPPI|nr:hypothetical protein NPIL_439351 [Nephila pilipes]